MKLLAKSMGLMLMVASLSTSAMMLPSSYNYDRDFFGINKVFNYADQQINKALRNLDAQKSFYNNDMIKYFDGKNNSYVVMVNTDGYKKDELEVSVNNGVLNIGGKASKEVKSINKYSSNYGSFSYNISLPKDADEGSITSQHKNGMLYIKFTKTRTLLPKVRIIKITTQK